MITIVNTPHSPSSEECCDGNPGMAGGSERPLFLTDRKARPSVATNDVDLVTGRARLFYRRAAELFEAHTERYDDGPYTLHQLRRSRLTHAAEEGASTPVLMKLSGHTSVRSLRDWPEPCLPGDTVRRRPGAGF